MPPMMYFCNTKNTTIMGRDTMTAPASMTGYRFTLLLPALTSAPSERARVNTLSDCVGTGGHMKLL